MEYIFDFETLSTDRVHGVVLSLAGLLYDPKRFTESDQYEYTELLEKSHFIKFDATSQVNGYNRKIDMDTLEWWGKQSAEARQSQLDPSSDDQPLSKCLPFIRKHTEDYGLKRVFCRGNTFDNVMLDYIAEATDELVPWPHWVVRDTRSYIEGLAFGSDIRNNFVPEELQEFFVAHDPQHDIVMDVMRMQKLAIALG